MEFNKTPTVTKIHSQFSQQTKKPNVLVLNKVSLIAELVHLLIKFRLMLLSGCWLPFIREETGIQSVAQTCSDYVNLNIY